MVRCVATIRGKQTRTKRGEVVRDVLIECEQLNEDGLREPYNVDGGMIPFVLPETALVQIVVDSFTVHVPAVDLTPGMMIYSIESNAVIYIKTISVSPD